MYFDVLIFFLLGLLLFRSFLVLFEDMFVSLGIELFLFVIFGVLLIYLNGFKWIYMYICGNLLKWVLNIDY